jgi:CBASS immunity effector Cap15-like protein
MPRERSKMRRAFVYGIAIVICAVILAFLDPSSLPFTLIAGFMIGIAIPLLDIIAENARFLRFAYYSIRHGGKKIRISASYLFRIKVDNTYLLVRGHRWPHYQPVGGVYKFSPGAQYITDKLHILNDDLVPVDEASLNDLRVRIPARNIIPFVRWFESGVTRETSHWREFYEELVSPGIVPVKDFPFIFENFVRRDIPKIRFSSYAQSMELFIADIYDILPTPGQMEVLRALKKNHPAEVIWATESQIRRRGSVPGEKLDPEISETAEWIL